MYKLLNAGFYRLRKNKIFWGIIVITLCMGYFCLKLKGAGSGIDLLLLDNLVTIGLFISIFTSLFVGLEYANGTIRNKIVVGHSRIKIYLSNLIISITVGILIEFVYMLFVTIIGLPILGGLQMPISQFIKILLNIVMIIVTYSSIFNCITLLCNDITMSTVIGIILILAMFVADGALSQTANAEKYRYQITSDENGVITKEIIGIDQNYPGETKKKIAQFIKYIMPTGQANQIGLNVSNQIRFQEEAVDTTNLLWYSIGTATIINVMGIYFFSKKELK